MSGTKSQQTTLFHLQTMRDTRRNAADREQVIENGDDEMAGHRPREDEENLTSEFSTPNLCHRFLNTFYNLKVGSFGVSPVECRMNWKSILAVFSILGLVLALVIVEQVLHNKVVHNRQLIESLQPEVSQFHNNKQLLAEEDEQRLAKLEDEIDSLREANHNVSDSVANLAAREKAAEDTAMEWMKMFIRETNTTLCSDNRYNVTNLIDGVAKLKLSVRFRPNSVISPQTELFRLQINNKVLINGGSIRGRLINKNRKVNCSKWDPRELLDCSIVEEMVMVRSTPGDTFILVDLVSGSLGIVEDVDLCLEHSKLISLPVGAESMVVTH